VNEIEVLPLLGDALVCWLGVPPLSAAQPEVNVKAAFVFNFLQRVSPCPGRSDATSTTGAQRAARPHELLNRHQQTSLHQGQLPCRLTARNRRRVRPRQEAGSPARNGRHRTLSVKECQVWCCTCTSQDLRRLSASCIRPMTIAVPMLHEASVAPQLPRVPATAGRASAPRPRPESRHSSGGCRYRAIARTHGGTARAYHQSAVARTRPSSGDATESCSLHAAAIRRHSRVREIDLEQASPTDA